MSRRSSSRSAVDPCFVDGDSRIAFDPCYVNTIHEVSLDISESEDKKGQMKYRDSKSSLTSFERCFGGHVAVGDDEDVDDDARLPLRSVFSYFFRLLRFANVRTGG